LDADDYLLPEKIERQLAELSNCDAVDVAYSPVIMDYWEDGGSVRQELLEISPPHDPWVELIRWSLPQTGAALWRRSALIAVNGWKIEQPCCQEHELYLRLLQAEMAFQFCPTPGAVYRQWSTNTVCRRSPHQTIERRLAIVDAAEQHLRETSLLNVMRQDAIALARLECARSLYQFDRDGARCLARKARHAHPGHKLSPLPCFPAGYRWIYQFFGFRIAEAAAQAVRPLRRYQRA
jgi:hypothetical protein